MPTLQKLLLKSDNNYRNRGKLPGNIKRPWAERIISKFFIKKGCSIIIPFFDNNFGILEKCLLSIQNQDIPSVVPIEIIVVDDGSPIKLQEKKLKKMVKKFPIVYIKLQNNQGRAIARNTGLMYAAHDLIIFIDSDVVVPKRFIFNHLLFHCTPKNSAVVGFSCSIDSGAKILKLENIKHNIAPPTYKKDFRYKKFVPLSWGKTYKNMPTETFGKNYFILKESNFFSKMGTGKFFGVWDLPFMFITRNASAAKNDLIRAGGFDERFKGWGMEDVHMGAKLIALGLYIIPNIKASCYHVVKKNNRDGHKIKEFIRNLSLYNRIKKEEFKIMNEKQWLAKMKKLLNDKFMTRHFYPAALND